MKARGGCNYFEGIVGITLVQYGIPLKATGTMEWDNSLFELGVSVYPCPEKQFLGPKRCIQCIRVQCF